MATTLKDIGRFLYEADMKFKLREEKNDAVLSFVTDKYRDKDGDASLAIIVRIDEDGDYLSIFAPNAFLISKENVAPFLETCSIIQWKTKLIQFEYDDKDGEIRPVIEFPLEDAFLTKKQLMRCVVGLFKLIEEYYLVLDNVLKTGAIDFSLQGESAVKPDIRALLESLPIELLEEVLRKKKGEE